MNMHHVKSSGPPQKADVETIEKQCDNGTVVLSSPQSIKCNEEDKKK